MSSTFSLGYDSDLVLSVGSRDNRASSTFGPVKPGPDPCPYQLKDLARPTSTSRIVKMDHATSSTTSVNPVNQTRQLYFLFYLIDRLKPFHTFDFLIIV